MQNVSLISNARQSWVAQSKFQSDQGSLRPPFVSDNSRVPEYLAANGYTGIAPSPEVLALVNISYLKAN